MAKWHLRHGTATACGRKGALTVSTPTELLARIASDRCKRCESIARDEASAVDFDHCRVCGKELPADLKEWSHRHAERKACSTACIRTEIKRRFACCDKAEINPCVCMYSFVCPVHGTIHIGTHD